ncbi:MAG: hypothetical protein H5T70_04225, partial [Chloroflexi bacterium]|nr:hypothetical protein [Chloroflexota bacterium]
MFRTYGPQHWWPGETPFEIIVGAVLTQNTAWNNVSRAIANLKEAHLLTLDALYAAEADTVLPLISPSGFYHVKYRRLKALLGYLKLPGAWEYLQTAPVEEARTQLLAIHGIGP